MSGGGLTPVFGEITGPVGGVGNQVNNPYIGTGFANPLFQSAPMPNLQVPGLNRQSNNLFSPTSQVPDTSGMLGNQAAADAYKQYVKANPGGK